MEPLYLAIARVLLSLLGELGQRFRRVSVSAHRGYFAGQPEEQIFVTVTNLSEKKEIEVVRVWLNTIPSVEVLAQQLPKRLKTDESWATWLPVASVSSLELPYAEYRLKVRLSSGKEVRSVRTKNPAPMGYVPGTSARKPD
jgi:hypothetical protein